MKKLIIIDLKKNYEINRKNCTFISVNRGSIELKNSKKISFDVNNQKKNIENNKKDLINFFLKIEKRITQYNLEINTSELEFFNLRNDKYDYFDKILVFYALKQQKYHKKYTSIEIITDQENLEKFYKSIFGKNILITNTFNGPRLKNECSLIILKYFKFILKAFYFLVLIKIFKKNKKISRGSELFLSFYPYFFKKKDMNLYNLKQNTYLNFSLTDETHLNLSPLKYFKHIRELSKFNRIISVEKYINFSELAFSFKKFYFNYLKFNNFLKEDFFFQGINCTNLIIPHIAGSFLNRSKLFIYEQSLNRFYEENEPKKLHYFLFEYNFGFFLKERLKKINQFIGYQHGIFTKNLMWLDLINLKKKYLPEVVCYNQKKSKVAYKKSFKRLFYKKKRNNFDKDIKIIKNQSSDILVFLGQHDMNDCIYYFLNNKKYSKKKIFFKIHPNNKKKIISPSKNFLFINQVDKKKKFNIFLSPTTTIIYDFLNRNLKFNKIKFKYKVDLWG